MKWGKMWLRKTGFLATQRCFLRYYSTESTRGKNSFLTITNSQYMEYIYELWQQDKNNVDESWNQYFHTWTTDHLKVPSSSTFSNPPTHTEIQAVTRPVPSAKSQSQMGLHDDLFVPENLAVNAVIRAYQSRAHLVADLDPLGIINPEAAALRGTSNLADPIVVRKHLQGMTEADMNREFYLGTITKINGGGSDKLQLREIIKRLNQIYCGHVGLEYSYIDKQEILIWLKNKFEPPGVGILTPEHRKWIWRNIMRAVTFEAFLARKYPTEKRFGLEGCDSFVASLKQLLESAADEGIETVAIGMAHRGRLNTLINVCKKPMHQLLSQFKPIAIDGLESGDVKYHLGTCMNRMTHTSGKEIHVTVMPNPSHLEAINPVTVGRIRAEQVAKNDGLQGKKSVPILVHGDASFCGQGVIYELMHLTKLPDYSTGGVIHVIINNQIGFTLDSRMSRSTHHCTDLARMVNAPIFHVNADDPDEIVYCSKVAMEYRNTFNTDVVLDIVGYRRNGHNEMDEPMLTQPYMYKRIQSHPNVLQVYTDKLLKEGIIDEAYAKQETDKYLNSCEQEYEKALGITTMHLADWYDVPYTEFFSKQSPDKPIPTSGIPMEDIVKICNHVSTAPKDIVLHTVVKRIMARRKQLNDTQQFDWAMAEMLAISSLLKEGHHVRLSGEDVERGTFSHRVHVLHDQERANVTINHLVGIFPNEALYSIFNSPVSEFGVLGFELGYSAYSYESLVLWEAQFGDFANGCQVVIDNMLASCQAKWARQVGLVLLLPHGMEGQGPEHSSARLERFLKLSSDEVGDYESEGDPDETMTKQLFYINWIICNLTTPANLVHALRRQLLMPFRKPLVIMTPKSLLRHPLVQSKFEDIGPDTQFQALIPDDKVDPKNVKKIMFCSGKVYFDLLKERKDKKLEDTIAIIRIEQITPFPYSLLVQEVSRFPKGQVMWVQEEHKNMGAYTYVRDRIAHALKIPVDEVKYAGRLPSGAPATGSKIVYENEYKQMMAQAFELYSFVN